MEFIIRGDLSILWRLPQESAFRRSGLEAFKNVSIFTEDGEQVGGFGMMFGPRYIDSASITAPLVSAYPQQPSHIIIHLSARDTNCVEYLRIDISDIRVIVEGEEVTPGTLMRFENQWVPRELTLANGRYFQAGAYYLLSSYEKAWCRECPPEFGFGQAIFKTTSDTQIICNRNNEFGHMNSGGLNVNDTRLQEIFIIGNTNDGFTILATPESAGSFLVESSS